MIDWLIDWWLIDLIDWLIDWPHNWPFRGVTLCLAVLANASSLLKTPSLHSTMTCSSTAKDWIFVAEIASPKPSSRTRPPLDAAIEASLCMYGVSQRSITGLPMITKCSSVSSYFAPASFHNGLQFSPRPKILISAILSAPTVNAYRRFNPNFHPRNSPVPRDVVALHTYFVHKQGREKRQEISWCVILRDRKTSGKRKKFEQTEDNFVALWPGHQAGAVIFKHVTHETVRYWYKELQLF